MNPAGSRRASRGGSLPELLVGLVVGSLVVAGCATVWTTQLRQARRQTAETRLTQDLEGALERTVHELRRAGYWNGATRLVVRDPLADPLADPLTDPTAARSTAPAANPFAAATATNAAGDTLTYAYSLDAPVASEVGARERFGLRLRAVTLEAQVGAGNWQPLTDPDVATVTGLRATVVATTTDLGAGCALACRGSGSDCPAWRSRRIELAIDARVPADPAVRRSVRTRVLLRNPELTGRCPP